MNSIGSIFTDKKITPIYIRLTGHTEKSQWSDVSADKWRIDFYKALCQAHLISKSRNIPMYAFGYSLGSIVIQDAIEKFQVKFKHVFHISPGFKTRWYSGLITALFKVGFEFSIPSSNFVDYRAKDETSLLAYRAMWELNDKLKHDDENQKEILMDYRDELIDFTSTKALCERIKNCTFHELKNTPFKRPKTIYHLSIDPTTTGQKSWQYIRKVVTSKL